MIIQLHPENVNDCVCDVISHHIYVTLIRRLLVAIDFLLAAKNKINAVDIRPAAGPPFFVDIRPAVTPQTHQ